MEALIRRQKLKDISEDFGTHFDITHTAPPPSHTHTHTHFLMPKYDITSNEVKVCETGAIMYHLMSSHWSTDMKKL